MGQYEPAFKITVYGNEGGYNPGNGEAETYMGLDRGQHPKHPLWVIIDAIKKQFPGITIKQMNAKLAAMPNVQAMIRLFYKTDFWDTLRLDEVKDQQVSNNLFDCTINPCMDSAANVMQKACNKVSANALVVDGQIGPVTIALVNTLDPESLNTAINSIRAANYRHRVQLTPSKAEWLPVWLRRLVPYKHTA